MTPEHAEVTSRSEVDFPAHPVSSEQLHKLQGIKAHMRAHLPSDVIYASLGKKAWASELPLSVWEFMSLVQAPQEAEITFQLDHFLAHDVFSETYSIHLTWDQAQEKPGAQINALHFNVDPQTSSLHFYPSDRQTDMHSDIHFPYFGEANNAIPTENGAAVAEHHALDNTIQDTPFRVKLIDDIISIFDIESREISADAH